MVYHHNHVPICGISSFQFQAPNPTAEVQGQLVVILVWHNLACGRRNKKGEARRALVMNPLKFYKYSILYIYKFTRFTIHNGQASIWVLATMRLLWFNYTKRIDDKTPLIPIWPLPCRQWANRWSSRLQLNPKSGSPASWRAPAMHTWPAQKEASPAWPVLLFLKCGFGLFNHVSIYMYMYII